MLCGDKFAKNLVFLTTMWDTGGANNGGKREAVLKERFWGNMIHHGATIGRFYKNNRKSAWMIVDSMIQRHQVGQALLLQEEMVDRGKPLNMTYAWKALSGTLETYTYQQAIKDALPKKK